MVAERELATAAQIDATLTRATKAQRGWRAAPLDERMRILTRFVEVMEAKADAMGDEIAWQISRPVRYEPNEIRRRFAERALYDCRRAGSSARCRDYAR